MHVALLEPGSAEAYHDHLIRSARESGRGDTPVFRIRSADDLPDLADSLARAARWALPVDGLDWERTFALWDGDAIRGHVDLHGTPLPSLTHRASLGMALEAPYRRQGWGRRMLEAAIAWCRDAGLAWLDLGVFEHNRAARALYESLGFEVIGRTPDRFRVDGQSIDDLTMTLRL